MCPKASLVGVFRGANDNQGTAAGLGRVAPYLAEAGRGQLSREILGLVRGKTVGGVPGPAAAADAAAAAVTQLSRLPAPDLSPSRPRGTRRGPRLSAVR